MHIARRSSIVFHGLIALIVGGGIAVVGARLLPQGWWLGVVVAGVVLWKGLRKPLRRWRVAQRPLPPVWRAWLDRHIALYRRAAPERKAGFERDVKFVLDEWRFEGVGGVAVTDELRLSVAAGVAVLVHGRPDWELSSRRTVLFYPERFDDAYEGSDKADYDGMAHAQGPVILTIRAVEESWAYSGNGDNVVLHELAHLFDLSDAFADGVPSLLDPASAEAWQRLVRREMRRAQMGRSLLRRYAATDSAELFAVAVENFFERPEHLAREHAALFNALVALFNLDPRMDSQAPEGSVIAP